MKIMIEFYRTRDADNAHAVVGREIAESIDLVGAIGIGRALSRALDMTQLPDCMSITDAEGNRLYSGQLSANDNPEERMPQ
jgi:hypothetical protein